MTPSTFRAYVLRPGLEQLHQIGGPRPSLDAERLLLAIAGQESGLAHRYQVLGKGKPGAARGWWQFEAGGGVAGVMRHPSSAALARRLCDACAVAWDQGAIWRAIEGHDTLATGFGRLLVWTDPGALPQGERAGWDYYLRNWRPGKPHPDTWAGHWQKAERALAIT